MRKFFYLLSLSFCSSVFGMQDFEKTLVDFYQDLNRGDSTLLASYFHKEARIMHAGDSNSWEMNLSSFLKVCPKFKSDYYAEEVLRVEIKSFEQGLTYADVYFQFYVTGDYHHSGVDHFIFTTRNDSTKIESVITTDFKSEFVIENKEEKLDSLMNQWHSDAAQADDEAYFAFMGADFIFLGTDPKERWTKKEFAAYCKPHFERKSTWNFKTNWRNWYFSDDKKTAWFEESLDTQMNECRGSGVLVLRKGEWKIVHYNLAVTIENEKMKKFIKLRRK